MGVHCINMRDGVATLARAGTLLFIPILVNYHSPPDQELSRPLAHSLLGTSKADLVSCAGSPLHEATVSEGTILLYYKEISMLDESGVGSKGSRTAVHGGCRARVSLSGDRVVGIEYESVPIDIHAEHACNALFEACAQSGTHP